MSISPTLRCPCEGAFLQSAFQYDCAPAGETSFDLRGQPYRRAYDRCACCQHWFGRHELDLSCLYAHEYVQATYGGPEGMRRRYDKIMGLPHGMSDNRQRVARILTFVRERTPQAPRPQRLLDIGAGLGVFPAAMVEAGWRVMALEPDARTVEHLREVAGVEAHATNLLDPEAAALGTFDAITLNKVLEHVEDPLPLLVAARALLAPNGFVYIELPDVAAAVEGAGREEFFVEHQHVFSAASLAMLAVRAGFAVRVLESLREPSGKFTLRAFLEGA